MKHLILSSVLALTFGLRAHVMEADKSRCTSLQTIENAPRFERIKERKLATIPERELELLLADCDIEDGNHFIERLKQRAPECGLETVEDFADAVKHYTYEDFRNQKLLAVGTNGCALVAYSPTRLSSMLYKVAKESTPCYNAAVALSRNTNKKKR